MLAVELSTQLCNTQEPGWNEGEETQKHRGRDRGRWDEEHALLPCTPPHQQTHTQTLPLLCSNNGSIATNKCTRTGSEGTKRKITPQNQARQWVNKKKNSTKRKRTEYLALPSGVRVLEEKNQRRTERKFENNSTPILQLYCHYACFAWWQTMAITLKAKLSQVHLKAFCWNRQMTNKASNTVCEYKIALQVVYWINDITRLLVHFCLPFKTECINICLTDYITLHEINYC